ncbi:hypothetical protein ATCC90586_008795 [Pythium insidiosum]|nr:hypothetical protein ATCC90586_008795 [Pythium insidiosum]
MGAKTSKAVAPAYEVVGLAPRADKLEVFGSTYCFPVAKKWIVTKRTVNVLSITRSFSIDMMMRDADDPTGEVVLHLDGVQMLWDSDGEPLAALVGNPGANTFDVRNVRTNDYELRVYRVLLHGKHTTFAKFVHHATGKLYTLGYTGDWQARHHISVWVAGNEQGDQRSTVARVSPLSAVGRNMSYALEVAAGVDAALVLVLCYVLDHTVAQSDGVETR